MRYIASALVAVSIVVGAVYVSQLLNSYIPFCGGVLVAASIFSGKEILNIKLRERDETE